MHTQRGLVTPAIVTSTIVLIVCAISWGALAVVAIVPTVTLDAELDRTLNIMLATLTICSTIVHLTARALRSILAACARNFAAITTAEREGGYAEGYADGLSAAPVSPAVTRLVRAPR